MASCSFLGMNIVLSNGCRPIKLQIDSLIDNATTILSTLSAFYGARKSEFLCFSGRGPCRCHALYSSLAAR